MRKISEKVRRILRAVYRGLGMAAVSLAVQTCNCPPEKSSNDFLAPEYGVPHSHDSPYELPKIINDLFDGMEPIYGIRVPDYPKPPKKNE